MVRKIFGTCDSYDGNVRHIAFPCENGNDSASHDKKASHIVCGTESLEFAKENLQMTNREGFYCGFLKQMDSLPKARVNWKELSNS